MSRIYFEKVSSDYGDRKTYPFSHEDTTEAYTVGWGEPTTKNSNFTRQEYIYRSQEELQGTVIGGVQYLIDLHCRKDDNRKYGLIYWRRICMGYNRNCIGSH